MSDDLANKFNLDKESLEKGPAAPDNTEAHENGSEESSSKSDSSRSDSSGSDSSDEKKNPGRITVDLPPEMARKAKAAAYYMPGVYLYTLVQEGVRRVIEELEEEMGEELPTNVDQLKGGRPNALAENNRRWDND